MTDRCKIGDVAIIIRDEVGCEVNIGRFVHICGPRKVFPDRGTVWRIEPIIGATITYLDDATRKIMCGEAIGIEHADAWLIPVKPEGFDDSGHDEVAMPRTLETEAL
jgi:hypothetical protein